MVFENLETIQKGRFGNRGDLKFYLQIFFFGRYDGKFRGGETEGGQFPVKKTFRFRKIHFGERTVFGRRILCKRGTQANNTSLESENTLVGILDSVDFFTIGFG